MNRCIVLLALALVLPGLGCASAPFVEDLNDPARSESMTDFAPLGDRPESLPFEFSGDEPLAVGVNVQRAVVGDLDWHWVRVHFENQGEAPMTVSPFVEMRDADGRDVPSVTRDAFLEHALGTGQVYDDGIDPMDAATTVANPLASAFGLGLLALPLSLLSPLMSSGDQGVTGSDVARWAMDNWLEETFVLEAGDSRGGVLAFAAPRPLPMTCTVSTERGVLTYETRGEIVKETSASK